ncbi:GPI inositol-deacylase PGAP1-like protein [Heracleum sosnowskyi]|uniref:GPI inositol-deacylase PGAP1-like protein n=1 Tax=Heracleum sosnowskyi TaxID=360622 RepID=A0AAD8MYX1_9APIA|nr:GPI inositol-deacylase PGAP1-like protein [Heracleum sosnowskyi]
MDFINALKTGFNQPMMGLTENNSATHLSSGNPCLDFFFHVIPSTPSLQLIQRLETSWSHDPLTTLKLICNLRGVRGTGKSDKEGFYTAALWLQKHHPKTLACNAHVYASFGYFKDFLEILFRLLQGPDARAILKKEWKAKNNSKGRGVKGVHGDVDFKLDSRKRKEKDVRSLEKKLIRDLIMKEVRVEDNKAKMLEDKQRASQLRKENQAAKAKKAMDMFNNDMNYRFLHESVSTLFADILKADMEWLNLGKTNNISLAGKWCPTIDSSYDRYTLICASIAKKIFPLELYPEYEDIGDDQYVCAVRNRLRKQVLVPLHEALKLPEVYMSARKWGSLPYKRVASVAMKTYTDIFMDHDKERFSQYLEDVKQGKANIAAGALLPHDIIRSCLAGHSDEQETVAELQWKRMVDDMLKKGKLTSSIAVSDVSGSMAGTPMEVSVALGLLVSELSDEPWKGQVITFSSNPELQMIKGSNLREKCQFVKGMKWGMNTNFQKVFDQILQVAVAANLSEEQMIKRVFVFSDMEFDEACLHPWETDYMVIQRKFREQGYKKVPDIVFWNLRDSSATPVKATQNGVALLSGFSKNLLTIFLEEAGQMNPETVMMAAISGDDYQKLVLYD